MGRPEKLCATCALLRSQLDSLHARIRGLAVDCGAVQTEDAVEDVRRAVERLRLLAVEARAGRKVNDHLGVCFEKWDDPLDAYEDWFTSKLWNVYAAARAAAGEE